MAYPDQAKPQLLAGVAPSQVAQHKVIVVPDYAQYDIGGGDALCALRLHELASLLHLQGSQPVSVHVSGAMNLPHSTGM